jgi:hypothetical protein
MPAKKLKAPPALSARDGDVLLLVGTMKGLFLFRSSPARGRWQSAGPFFPGASVYGAAFDGRAGRRRIWAAPSSMHWGAELAWSDDLGGRTRPEAPLVRSKMARPAQEHRQIAPGRVDEPNTLYCGVEPSALRVARRGKSWT